jgi:orotate phosphoribosyltransferase
MQHDFLSRVPAREGHFRLESGHHAKLWLDLDTLFVEPQRVRPLVSGLAEALQAHDLAAVCGPLLGGAFLAQMLASALEVEFFFAERVLPPGREGLYGAEYRLPRGLRDRARGKRVAIVDDVISAGSAVRGTYAELRARGAQPVVIGALVALGSLALTFFAQERVPVIPLVQLPYELWPPDACPLCASALPLEDVAVPAAF